MTAGTAGSLSERGERLLANPHLAPYIEAHFERVDDLWDAATNRDGYIPMSIAENKLVWDLLEPKFAESRILHRGATSYDEMIGSLAFR